MLLNVILMKNTGPNLDTKCVQISDAALSHEILRKIFVVVKPLQKGLNRVCIKFSCPFFVKSALFC